MSKGTSKSTNSYSLLLKGAAEMEKRDSKKSSLSKKSSSNSESTRSEEQPTTSHKVEVIYDPDVPDRTYGDFYCKMCDSHMNAVEMWEAHITGKRHIKNVEKGDADSKYEDLPNAESSIKYELKNVMEPIVGLSYIHEIRRREPNIPPIYNCFLCHASLATVPMVTEHVMSLKHRLNYVKEKSYDEFVMINGTNLKKGQMEPLVIEAVVRLERELGQGEVIVKQEKKKKSGVHSKNSDHK